MANPIAFEPGKADPRLELQRRLDAAPLQHAEALLVAFDLLEEAHQKGLLDLMHGAIGSRDAIAEKLAMYAKQPESTAMFRNLLALGRLLGSINPELLRLPHADEKPPSAWQIFRRICSEDGRRGLNNLTSLLIAFGRANK